MGKHKWYAWIFFTNKQKWSTDIWYDVDRWTWKYYTTWKKSVTKDHKLYDSIYMKYLEYANLKRQNVDSSNKGWEEEQMGSDCLMDAGFLLR